MAAELPAFEPLTLEGQWVRLEPMTRDHLAGLAVAGADASIWKWLHASYETPERMGVFVDEALAGQKQGAMLPFVQVERRTATVVGSTRYLAIERAHRRAEIGYTWINPRWQRTAINTEAKYLLLTHAFETLALNRVEFKTDVLNDKSRNALARIGARQEGIFRKHMIAASGRVRDSVYFSVVDAEWPAVKSRLEGMMAKYGGAKAA